MEGLRTRVARIVRRIRRQFGMRSVLALLLIGFVLVTAPLVVGLMIAGQQIERVSREGEALLEQSVRMTRAAREAQERFSAYERTARQYRVLLDPEASRNLDQARDAFRDRIDRLRGMDTDGALRPWLDELSDREWSVTVRVLDDYHAAEWPVELDAGFREMGALTREVTARSELAATAALETLQQLGSSARTGSMIQLAFTLSLAVLLAVLVAGFIGQPIQRLDQGIRALARPSAGPLPRVDSPRDLRTLSVRLEWVRRKLQRAERDRWQLLTQVSHELKTPLTAIREGVSLLEDRVFGPLSEEQADVTLILKQNALRLQHQIEMLLRYNRLQTGLQPAERRRIRVADLVDDVLGDHALELLAQETEVTVDIDPEAALVGDRDMLRTALDNLLSNALKYSPQGEPIGIHAARHGRQVTLDVMDNGQGIRATDRRRVFEPFFRGHGAPGKPVSGSGLGLSICLDLVRMHDGDVSLIDLPGWRTVFRITLPSAPGPEALLPVSDLPVPDLSVPEKEPNETPEPVANGSPRRNEYDGVD